jgi:uncharacterized membrane protein YhhN
MSALTDGTGAITVNVGGTVYMTTLATLTRVEGSMLGALAEAFAASDEVLFIDRDVWYSPMGQVSSSITAKPRRS